jgi:penicillin-binding protein 1C
MGAREAVAVLRRSGLELKDGAEKYGVSIALGSAEVSPAELADAYAMLARGGERHGERVFDPTAVALVVDALSDPLARVRGLHARGPFELPFPVAVKTGTSTGFRDAWTAGFTHERTVVVWVGNASGAPTNRVTGASGAGPIFFDVMRRAMRDVGSRAALADAALTEESAVCALSGERPGDACPDRVERRFARGHVPDGTCKMHRHARARLAAPGDVPFACAATGDKTIVVLPEAYGRFLGERAPGAPGMDAHGLGWFLESKVPGCESESASPAAGPGGPRVVLVRPHPGAVFHADEAPVGADVFEVVAATEGMPDATALEVLVDGQVRASLAPPYKGLVAITRGEHYVEVRPRDAKVMGRVARAEISVR